MDLATIATAVIGAVLSAVMGLGWLRSHDQVRLAEIQVEEARVKVAADQVQVESSAFSLYKNTLSALQASNQATQEANHYSDEMRAESRRLREAQSSMRSQLDECIAARAASSESIARLTQQQAGYRADAQAEIAELRAEVAALRKGLEGDAAATKRGS